MVRVIFLFFADATRFFFLFCQQDLFTIVILIPIENLSCSGLVSLRNSCVQLKIAAAALLYMLYHYYEILYVVITVSVIVVCVVPLFGERKCCAADCFWSFKGSLVVWIPFYCCYLTKYSIFFLKLLLLLLFIMKFFFVVFSLIIISLGSSSSIIIIILEPLATLRRHQTGVVKFC